MAAMATPEPAMRTHVVEVRGPSQGQAWALWIIATVIGAAVGALVAFLVRDLFSGGSAFVGQSARYVATVLQAIIIAGTQWLVWRRYRLELDWWVPATVAATLLNAIVVIPSVLHLADGTDVISQGTAMIAGGSALGAAGLIVGVAQALVLRGSAGNIIWAWIPATIVGGALAGALTTALSAQFFGMAPVVAVSLLSAIGALLSSASQAPVFLRVLR
jgi:MFS family permease